MTRTILACVALVSMSALGVACGPKQPADDPNGFNSGYGGSGYAGAGGGAGAGGYAGYAGTGGAQAGVGGTAGASGGAGGASANPADIFSTLGTMFGAMLGSGGPNDAIAIGIQANAQQQAPGMQPAGSAIRLNLQQGQVSEGQFTLEPGKCYTLVGASNPGVIETSIKVTMLAPLQTQVLGQNAAGPNPMPVVWGGGNCYRTPSPIAMPVRLEVKMVTGAGQIGIQPYAK